MRLYLLLFFIFFNHVTLLTAEDESDNIQSCAQLSNNDLTDGPKQVVDYNKIYTADLQKTTKEYMDEIDSIKSDNMAVFKRPIDQHTTCIEISYQYDGFKTIEYIELSDPVGGETPSHPAYIPPKQPGNPSQTSLTSLKLAKDRLETSKSNLQRKNKELHEKEGQLNGLDDEFQKINGELNRAGQGMEDAAKEAQNTKGDLDRIKQEIDHLNSERNKLKTDLTGLQNENKELNNRLSELVQDIGNKIKQTANSKKIENYQDNVLNQVTEGLDKHNEALSDIDEKTNIKEGRKSLDNDLEGLIEDIPNNENIDLVKFSQANFKTPTPHKHYPDLVRAQRYHNGAQRIIEDENGPHLNEQKDLLSLADLQIDVADQAFAENDNQSGKGTLNSALVSIDMALSFIPFIGAAKDAISLLRGHNPITGEEIGTLEKGLILGTFLVPSLLSGGVKGLVKVSRRFQKIIDFAGRSKELAKKMLNIIKKSDQEYSKIFRFYEEGSKAFTKIGEVSDKFFASFGKLLVDPKKSSINLLTKNLEKLSWKESTESLMKLTSRWKRSDSLNSVTHVIVGDITSANKIKGGLHTNLGLKKFLKKRPDLKNVTKIETLSNGVKRVELPASAFNSKGWDKTIKIGDKGGKTLFPESWNMRKIFQATNEVIKDVKIPTKGRASYEKMVDEVIVKVATSEGQVITSFPTWGQ